MRWRPLVMILTVLFLFDSSPSVDVVGYGFEGWGRRVVEVPCAGQETPPCYGTTLPFPVEGIVLPSSRPDAQYEVHVPEIPPWEVTYGCVYALDGAGNQSRCIGGPEM